MTRYARIAMLGRIMAGLSLTSVAFSKLIGRQEKIVLFDVGGRGGLSPAWHALWHAGVILPVIVEPDVEEAARLAQQYPGARVISTALWSDAGTGKLHITEQPGCSSLLVPEPDPRMPQSTIDMMRVEREITVAYLRTEDELRRLDIQPEIIKIDVQGGELEILRGFGSLLDSVFCCELEVSFMRGYKNQPLFDEIYDFMIGAGFGLFDMQVFGVAGTRNAIQADVFFCRQDSGSVRQKWVEDVFRKVSGYSNWQ